jgi:aminopeptidase N
MENTTATILGDKMLRPAKHDGDDPHGGEDPDDLISHELAHQWFGDCVTCRSWEHIWLNEGWATYADALWQFHKAGEGEPGLKALRATMEHYRDDQAIHNIDPAATVPAIADRRYAHTDDVFSKSDDPYAKGAWILHMLHEQLGDAPFWNGVHAYLRKWAFSEAETSDLRRELEAASGESLEQFFLQWCKTPGIPSIEYAVTWDQTTGAATIQWRQLQAIDAARPAWRLPLQMRFRRDKETWDRTLLVDAKAGIATFTLSPGSEPELEMDPDMASLCSVRSSRPPEPAPR